MHRGQKILQRGSSICKKPKITESEEMIETEWHGPFEELKKMGIARVQRAGSKKSDEH